MVGSKGKLMLCEGGNVALSVEDTHLALPVGAWQVEQMLSMVFIVTVESCRTLLAPLSSCLLLVHE